MSSAAAPTPTADYHFFRLGVEYYVVARFAALARMMPLAGNQYHHAIEMLLKGQLAKTLPIAVLKKKYSHNLKRTWKKFKKLFPAEDLSPFDDLLSRLNRFERLRYPDNALSEGMAVAIPLYPPPAQMKLESTVRKSPSYQLAVTDLDRFVATLFCLCSMDPVVYMRHLDQHAVKAVEYENPVSKGWFPNR
jgi:hypothetical protein